MLTTAKIVGLLAFVGIAVIAAYLLQRLDTAISNPTDSGSPETAGSAPASPARPKSAPRVGRGRRHGR
jgi:hypothetical protein